MKLEDAFLYVVFGDDFAGQALVDMCGGAIAGGADIVQVNAGDNPGQVTDEMRRLAGLCREEEALLVLRDDAALAAELGDVGVHLSEGGMEMGIVRAIMDGEGFLGVSTHTLDDARLSLEVGVDYLIHHGGMESGPAFAALRDDARVPLFAAGIAGLDDAQALVNDGIFRLCIDAGGLDGDDMAESVACFSRLLGRCV